MSFRTPPSQRTASPTIATREALAISQQAHIDDLVQRNRTAEQDRKKLEDEVVREKTRAKEAVKQIQTRWQQDNADWKEGCNTFLACHKIAQLCAAVELNKERLAVVKQEDTARKERLSTLQRDYKITTFQMREMELDDRIAELEDELAELREHNEDEVRTMTEQHNDAMQKLTRKCSELAAEIGRLSDARSAAQKERDKVQDKTSDLREEIAQLRARSESTTSKLDRVSLQLEGAQTTNAELERLNDELKRNEAELRRQLDKWQNLENKGGAEAEVMRKRRIELEVQVKELESRLRDANEREQEATKTLEKEQRRVTKLKDALEQWRQATVEAQEDAETQTKEAAETANQAAKAQKQISKLKAALEAERAKVRASVPKGEKSSRKVASELEEDKAQSPSSGDEVAQAIDDSAPPAAASSSKARPKPKPKPVPAEDSEFEVVSGKDAREKAGKRDMENSNGAPPRAKRASSKKPRNDDVDKPRAPSRAGSVQPRSIREEDDEDVPTKKKKRKINIFGSAQDTTFAWDQILQGDNDLGIPTVLSPVKEPDPAPNRSVSLLGRFGSVIGSSFRR